MVSEATRGVKFVIKAELDPNVSKPFEALEAHVDALEKRLAGLKIPAPVAARITGGVAPSGGSNGSPGANGSNGSATGGMPAGAQADLQKQADAQKNFRRHLSEIRLAADERDRLQAEKTAKLIEKANQESLDQQIKDLKKAQAEQEKLAEQHAKQMAKIQAAGWKSLSEMGADALDWSKKREAGMSALSAAGHEAMLKTGGGKWAEGMRRIAEERERTSGWRGLSEMGKDAVARFDATREREEDERKKAEVAERRAMAERREEQERLREGIDATIDSVSRLARGFAQLGLIGETDLHRITDTMLGVQGTIDTVRGSIDSFRSIRGGLKSLGVLRGAGGASAGTSAALAGLGEAGGASAAGGIGMGTVALAGAGVTALLAGGVGLAGTIADYRRGVAGNVGGFWDTIGRRINSPIGSLQRGLMNTGSALERAFNEPYGLTKRQSELRSERLQEEQFKQDYGNLEGADEGYWVARKRAELVAMRTERMQRFRDEDFERREQMRLRRESIDAEEAPLNAQVNQSERQRREEEFSIRSGRIRSHGQIHAGELSQAFGRQREAFGEQLALQQQQALGNYVDPAKLARATAEQAREEGEVTRLAARQQENLRLQLTAHRQRGVQLGRDFADANQRYNSADSEAGRKTAFAQRVQIQEQINQHAREEQQIREKTRQLSVDGAERQLALQQQSLATAKQTADALRQQRQSAAERFGQLLPGQQRAVLSAAQKAASGARLNRHEANLLRPFPELAAPLLRKHDVELAEKGGFSQLTKVLGFDKQLGAAEGQERQAIQVAVANRHKISAELHTNVDETARELMSAITPLLNQAHEALKQEVEKQIQALNHELAAKDRQQARAAAGE